jgi:hypothetical protein
MRLLATLLFGLFTSALLSQEYVPLLNPGNSWFVDVYYNPFDPQNPIDPYTITYQIDLGGGTHINGDWYTEILKDGQVVCLITEDIDTKMVYKYDEQNNVARVLFDFNLDVGDVFDISQSAYASTSSYCGGDGGPLSSNLTVASVETVNIVGFDRKIITFEESSNTAQYQWIEGIGNITGFDLMHEAIDITDGSLLTCLIYEGDILVTFNGITSCINTTLSKTDFSKETTQLYPNPVKDVSVLQIDPSIEATSVKIYNTSGKLIGEKALVNGATSINAMHYASGLYFYTVYDKNKAITTRKFVVR